MTDRGIASWTDGLSDRESVREIVLTITRPRTVEWICEEARVSSWQTAKDELERLIETGKIRSIDEDDGTMYSPVSDWKAEVVDDYCDGSTKENP